MATWRSAEVEAALGASLDAAGLTEEVFTRLVDQAVREGEQLDFKLNPHLTATKAVTPAPGKNGQESGWSAEQEFAKDVCSFANHLGGVLLIGIDEKDEVAVGVKPTVADPGAVEQRLRNAAVNFAAPTPRFQCIPIPAAAGDYYMAILVPPSPSAPHAVRGALGNDRRPLQYPVRDGTDTRWLLEHEVADRYRARSTGRAAQASLRDETVERGLDALRYADDSGLWLYLAIAPEAPAAYRLDQATTVAMTTWLRRDYRFASPLHRVLSLRAHPTPAPGRLTVSGSPARLDGQEDTDPRDDYLELYVDGRAFVATPVETRTSDSDPGAVGELTLADDTILLTDLAVSWAAHQAGAWGAAELVVGLTRQGSISGTFTEPVTIHSQVGGALHRIRHTRRVRGPIRAVTSADLSTCETQLGRLGAARDVITVLWHHFGLSEAEQLEPDGTPALWGWGRMRDQVEQWARDREIPTQSDPRSPFH